MWWLKGCSRCGGDLFLDMEYWEVEGIFIIGCLQCGRELSRQEARRLLFQRIVDRQTVGSLAASDAQGR